MLKFKLMLNETEATSLRDLLESLSDRGICDKVQRRTVDYVLDEINLMYPKKIHKNYTEYIDCCEPLSAITDSEYGAFNEF